jgi:WD40 repeat protein
MLRIPDYDLLRRIGAGAYGEVWLARSTATGVLRAAKIVWRRTFEDDRPFEREFEGIQRFEEVSREHPSQLALFHIGRNDAEGYFYYIMELADRVGVQSPESKVQSLVAFPGPESGSEVGVGAAYAPHTLRADLAQGRLPAARVLEIGLALAEALGHLHGKGLIHRDVKPSNVIFVNGRLKLADIGLVTDASDQCSIVGTEGYLPPEGPGSPQADIFALGKVLYEAATGLDRRELPRLPENLRTWPDAAQVFELNEIILKACASQPKERYQTAEEMYADLALLHSGQSVRDRHSLERRLRVTRRVAAGVAAVMVLGVVPYTLAIRSAVRARRSEADLRIELHNSYLAQIRAGRLSHEAGQKRFGGLQLASKAAHIRTSVELRNEVIACLALPDIRFVKRREAEASWPVAIGFAESNVMYAKSAGNGDYKIRNFMDGREIASLPCSGEQGLEKKFSPDGKLFCAGHDSSSRQPPRIWDIAGQKLLFRPDVYGPRTWTISSDNKLIAIAQFDGRPVVIYELPTGRLLRSFAVDDLPWDLAFDPTSSLLAVSITENTNVLVFDVPGDRLVVKLPHASSVLGVAFSPDGKTLAVCAGRKIQIWNLAKATPQAELLGHDGAVLRVAFSPDGKFLASASYDGSIRLWNLHSLEEICAAPCDGYVVHFSPDGRWLANDYGSFPCLYEVNHADELRLLGTEPVEAPASAACDFSPDGQLVAVADEAGVGIWDVNRAVQLASVAVEQIRAAIFHPAGKVLITCGSGGIEARPFTRNGSSVSFGPPELLGAPAAISRASLTREGDRMVLVRNGRVCLLDLKTRLEKLIAGLPEADPRIISLGPLAVFAEGVPPGTVIYRTACVDPVGRRCAACRSETNLVQVFDTATGQLLQSLPTQGDKVCDLGFSPDGRWLASSGTSAYHFWDTASWRCLHIQPVTNPVSLPGSLVFSPDSAMAAITLDRRRIRLIAPGTGRELASLEGSDSRAIGMFAWSRDGMHLAVSGGNHPVQLWDLRLIRSELAAMNLDWNVSNEPAAMADLK